MSTVSIACRSVADFLAVELDTANEPIAVMIGHPAAAVPDKHADDHHLNLFFYQFESGGGEPHVLPGNPLRIRMRCMITAFGILEDQISAGENDLRLLGEVIRIFHEKPILDAVALDGETVRLQMIFQTLEAEEINNIWATQSDASFRPSVVYEIALVPIVPHESAVEASRVGEFGFEARTTSSAGAAFAGNYYTPVVAAVEVDSSIESWAPRICLVFNSTCVETLSFHIDGDELVTFQPEVWIAGDTAEVVSLNWEVWDAQNGWQASNSEADVPITSAGIDPAKAATAITKTFALPFKDHAGQAFLFAIRTYERGSDGVQMQIRSNPILVTLHEGKP